MNNNNSIRETNGSNPNGSASSKTSDSGNPARTNKNNRRAGRRTGKKIIINSDLENTAEKVAAKVFYFFGTAGFYISIIIFVLYVSGIISSSVLPSDAAESWSKSSSEYIENTNLDFNKMWFENISDGYIASTAAIAVIASVSLPVLLFIGFYWLSKKDYIYSIMSFFISFVILSVIFL